MSVGGHVPALSPGLLGLRVLRPLYTRRYVNYSRGRISCKVTIGLETMKWIGGKDMDMLFLNLVETHISFAKNTACERCVGSGSGSCGRGLCCGRAHVGGLNIA